jgi:hypothetical protein
MPQAQPHYIWSQAQSTKDITFLCQRKLLESPVIRQWH